MIAHYNVIAQSMQVQLIAAPDYEKALAVLPLFHSKFNLPTGSKTMKLANYFDSNWTGASNACSHPAQC